MIKLLLYDPIVLKILNFALELDPENKIRASKKWQK